MRYNHLFLFGSAILLSAAVAVYAPTNVSAETTIYNPENPTEPITPKEPEPATPYVSESSTEETTTSTSEKPVKKETPKKIETPVVKKPKKRYIKSDFFLSPVVAANATSQNGSGSGNDSFAGSQAAQTAYLLSGLILLGRKAT